MHVRYEAKVKGEVVGILEGHHERGGYARSTKLTFETEEDAKAWLESKLGPGWQGYSLLGKVFEKK